MSESNKDPLQELCEVMFEASEEKKAQLNAALRELLDVVHVYGAQRALARLSTPTRPERAFKRDEQLLPTHAH